MALAKKLEVVIEIQCSPGELYRFFTRDAPQLPKYVPEWIKSVEVIPEGEVCVGTVFVWLFSTEGRPARLSKEKVIAVDNKNRSIKWTVFEGDVLKEFKSFFYNLDIISKSGMTDGTTGLVKWSIEYEKVNEAVADPVSIVKMAEGVTTKMNLYLRKEA